MLFFCGVAGVTLYVLGSFSVSCLHPFPCWTNTEQNPGTTFPCTQPDCWTPFGIHILSSSSNNSPRIRAFKMDDASDTAMTSIHQLSAIAEPAFDFGALSHEFLRALFAKLNVVDLARFSRVNHKVHGLCRLRLTIDIPLHLKNYRYFEFILLLQGKTHKCVRDLLWCMWVCTCCCVNARNACDVCSHMFACYRLLDAHVLTIVKTSPQLTKLNLSCSYYITDTALLVRAHAYCTAALAHLRTPIIYMKFF